MPIVAICGASFCSAPQVAEKVAQRIGAPLAARDVLEDAAERSGISLDRIERAMTGKASFFNSVTHERERALSHIKAALARRLRSDDVVCVGPVLHLIPPSVTHALRVCLLADQEWRVARAQEDEGLSQKKALRRIEEDDEALARWTHMLHRKHPWDALLYDLKIPMQKTSVDEAVDLVVENALKDAVKPTDSSLQAALDFELAARTNVALMDKGHHYTDVTADRGKVTVIINKNVLRLDALERELKAIATEVDGVEAVDTKVGPGYNRPNIVRTAELDMPSKFLLVDDEREYVMTLSERLEMREITSEVAYDGQQALDYVAREEPDVMVLDLRMPGMDGLEVLRNIKEDHPRVEVIILTGHGSDKDRQMAMELGAFAYLQKPVDIDVLARTMREAAGGGAGPGDAVSGVSGGEGGEAAPPEEDKEES
jgi:CheY-like chemotaxis protein/cytidylate kinase